MKLEYRHLNWMQLVWDTELSTKAKITCACLASHMNANHHIAWPSVLRIASMTGLSKKSVERAVKEIESAGWLTVERGGINKGTSRYSPVFPEEVESQIGTQSRQSPPSLASQSPQLASQSPQSLASQSRPNQSIQSVNKNKVASSASRGRSPVDNLETKQHLDGLRSAMKKKVQQ